MATTTSDALWGAGSTLTGAQLQAFVDAATSGDTLVLSRTLNMTGSSTINLGGKVINIEGVPGNNGGFNRDDPLGGSNIQTLKFTGGTLHMLKVRITCTQVRFPTDSQFNTSGGVLEVDGCDNSTFTRCYFTAEVGRGPFRLFRSDDVVISWCHFTNEYAQGSGRSVNSFIQPMLYLEDCVDLIIEDSVFAEGLHETIKTSGAGGIRRPIIRRCRFKGLGRDAIDLTGGFCGDSWAAPARIEDCIFEGGASIDIKCAIKEMNVSEFPLTFRRCKFIDINNCTFYSIWNPIVLTTDDKWPAGKLNNTPGSAFYWQDAFTQDIRVRNCSFEDITNTRILFKSAIRVEFIDNVHRGTVPNDSVVNYRVAVSMDPAIKPALDSSGISQFTETGRTTASAVGAPPAIDYSLYGPLSDAGSVAAPDAFTVGQWTWAETGVSGELLLTFTTLPSNNGDPITDLEYNLDGAGYVSHGSTGGSRLFTGQVGAKTMLVRAVNSTGSGLDSDEKSATPTATVSGVPVISTPVPVITGSGVVNTLHTVSTGTWTNSPTGYNSGANVSASPSSGPYTFRQSGLSYAPTEADLGLYLSWGVQAFNAAGNSTYYDTPGILITAAASVPDVMTGGQWRVKPSATIGSMIVELIEAPASGSAITDYEIRFDVDSGDGVISDWISLGGTALTDYPLTGFTPGSTVPFEIRAVNSSGPASPSDVKLAYVPPVVTVGGTVIMLIEVG